MPQEYETDVSNVFAVTTPYADDVDADYYETHGALEFSPNSAVDPNAPTTNFPLGQRLQQRRETFDTLPQWTATPRGVRSASASAGLSTRGPGPNGNSPLLAARPGIQSIQASKHNPQLQPENHQVDRPDYDEMLGIRDDSDAEARMQRLLNQLESVTKPDSQNTHEGDWVSSPSLGYGQGAPPPSYENAQHPSMVRRGALAKLEDSALPRDPAPLYGIERGHPRGGGVVGHYTKAESRLSTSDRTLQFPNLPENITARSPLPRYKSAPSMPNTIAMAPQPSRSPPRSATTGTDAPARKPTLHRGRHGGSEQSLHDLSRQNLRAAQPGHGYGHFNSYGNLLLNPPITPASPGSVLPGLISDTVSRSSSFGSIQTRLVTPTDSTTPVLSGVPHPLGRIDEKSSLDHNEIEGTNEYKSPLFQTSSHSSSEAREREKVMAKTLGLKLSAPLPPSSWQTPTPAEHSLGNPVNSAMTTPAASFFEGGSTSGSVSFSGGPGGPGGLGGLRRSYSRSGLSEISSFTDALSRTSAGRTAPMRDTMSPSVLAATSFANNGTIPTGIALSKAEKAAEKARQKAEKAAKKAEAALLKVEQEREAKAQQEETKRASADSKRQAVDAKKREKEERQRQAELDLNMPRLMLFST